MGVRKEYAGAAAPTTLASGIDDTTLSITLADGSTFPTGSSFPFVITIDRGESNEERILVDSRSTNALTVNASGRGYDGTTGVSHSSGATVEHTLDAVTVSEANAHVNNTGQDDHTQYHNTTRADTWLGTKDTDDLAEGATNKYYPAAATVLTDIKTVDGTGSGLDADLLDGVEAAALLLVAATDLSSAAFFLDEDDLNSDDDTKVASQQSVKAYVDGIAATLYPLNTSIVTESTTTRTLGLTDATKHIRCTHASGCTVTVPPNASVAFPVGTQISIFAATAGTVTVAEGSGVTVNSVSGLLDLAAQNVGVALVKVATDTWDLFGSLA